MAALFSTQPSSEGRNVAMMTNAGGLGILVRRRVRCRRARAATLSEETVEACGGVLPREASVANPVDMLGGATADSYAAVLPVLLADPRVDAVIVLFVPAVSATADEVAAAIERAAAEQPSTSQCSRS